MAAARCPIGQRTMPIVNDLRHLLENITNVTGTQHVLVEVKREGGKEC